MEGKAALMPCFAMSTMNKPKILIADNSRINRMILTELLSDEYEVLQAENGREAISVISVNPDEIELVVLDLVMPVMDGFKTLKVMKERGWLTTIPVIVITSDDEISMEDAYKTGAVDFIKRPYNSAIIHNRIKNTLALYRKQKRLMGMVEEQIAETEIYSRQMIDILGNIVEFRNGESNLHIHNVQTVSRILLEHIAEITDKYGLTNRKIMLISTASALHDIGKIAIDENVLNKPGKLTSEEFEIIKKHSEIGSEMIKAMPEFEKSVNNENGIYKYAYEICRWHHERWNGFGYPDGLKGEEIPVSAQVVAMADVYDALTSERCYKPSYDHETAVKMILDGECGAFNPLLLNSLRDCEKQLSKIIHGRKNAFGEDTLAFKITKELIADKLYSQSEDNNEKKYLLSFESAKRKFFSNGIKEIQIEYDIDYGMITVSDYGVKFLNLDSSIIDMRTLRNISTENGNYDKLMNLINRTTPTSPILQDEIYLENEGKKYRCEVKIMTLWTGDTVLKRKSVVMRVIPNNSFESIDIIDMKNYNDREFEVFAEQIKKVFDIVRVVDPIETNIVSNEDYDNAIDKAEKTGKLKCYSIWGRSERCQNCISYKTFKTKKTQSKLEFLNDSVYQIFSKYMEINGEPRVVEMVYQNRSDLMFDAYGKNDFVNYVNSYNRKLYRDPLTDTLNRRYFDDVGRQLKNVTAVCMIDMDGFKSINDNYSHLVGDKAIVALAKAVSVNIGEKDKLIRYGGDEFLLLFVDAEKDEFTATLEKIVSEVAKVKLEEMPNYQFSITIGGKYGKGDINLAVNDADKLLYLGKTSHKHIVTDFE